MEVTFNINLNNKCRLKLKIKKRKRRFFNKNPLTMSKKEKKRKVTKYVILLHIHPMDEIKRWNLKEIAISSEGNEVDLFEVEI